MLSSIPQDVRVALRALGRQRAFAATAVLSLGIAIGLNTSVYSMLDAMLNPRIAGAHPERLYTVRYFGDSRHQLPRDAVSTALREGLRSYEVTTGYDLSKVRVGLVRGDRARDVIPMRVRSNFFAVVGTKPIAGRFTAAPEADANPAIVISDRLRAELFPDGDSLPIGATVNLDGRAVTVVAVTHRYSAFDALDADLWVLESGRDEALVPVNLMRLRERADPAQLYRELSLLSARLAQAAGESPRDTRFYYRPITRQFQVRGFQFALVGIVIAVLLIACANLGNLQLARGLNRAGELAVRASLGATRRALIMMLLTESALLAAGGLVLGLVFTYWGTRMIEATVPESAAGYFIDPQWSWRVGGVAAVVATACVVLVGLLPSIRLTRVDLNSLMKAGAGTGAHRGNRTRYGTLLAVQIALAMPVVGGAVLLARAARRAADPVYHTTQLWGFDVESLVVAHVTYPAVRGAHVPLAPIVADLVSRARGVHDVVYAAALATTLTDHAALTATDAFGQQREFPAPLWPVRVVTPDFFRTLSYPIEEGADFSDGAYAGSAVVVDRVTSTFLWPHGGAVGQLIKFGDARSLAPWLRVVGVRGDHLTPDARQRRIWLDTLRLGQVYRVVTRSDSVQAGRKGVEVTLYARATRNPRVAAIALRQSLAGINPAAPPQVIWMRDELGISDTIGRTNFVSALFSAVAFICLGLAAFGVYAIVSQSVAQRRREIAVRISLGASPRGVLALILREGNVFALAGVAGGLIVTVETIGWLGNFVASEDVRPLALAAISAGLFAVAALAALVPALRAAAVDPAEALRAE